MALRRIYSCLFAPHSYGGGKIKHLIYSELHRGLLFVSPTKGRVVYYNSFFKRQCMLYIVELIQKCETVKFLEVVIWHFRLQRYNFFPECARYYYIFYKKIARGSRRFIMSRIIKKLPLHSHAAGGTSQFGENALYKTLWKHLIGLFIFLRPSSFHFRPLSFLYRIGVMP